MEGHISEKWIKLLRHIQPKVMNSFWRYKLRYRLSLIGTDGTATAEFTLFGRVARQIISKPVISLIRSASKNHKKNLTQRTVSFQVNAIVTFFGKQNHIPNPTDLSYDRSSESSAIKPSTTFHHENAELSVPPKKTRLDHRAIPCRKNLTFDDSGDAEGNTSISDRSGGIEDTVDHGKNSDLPSEAATTTDCVTGAEQNSNQKVLEVPQDGTKQRSGGGRRKITS